MFISNLKISSVSFPTLFFYNIILAIVVLLPLHINYGTSLNFCTKTSDGVFVGTGRSMGQFRRIAASGLLRLLMRAHGVPFT